MRKAFPTVLGFIVVFSIFIPSNFQASAASINGSCRKAGAVAGTVKKPLVCKKVGKKLLWKAITVTTIPKTTTPIATTSTTASVKETVSQSNVRKSAASYLKTSSFSRSGLIKQLEYEGFSNADATYGADAQNADWNAQAAKSAASYLKTSSFSRSDLTKQLIYEGFTQSQAEYGVTSTGL